MSRNNHTPLVNTWHADGIGPMSLIVDAGYVRQWTIEGDGPDVAIHYRRCKASKTRTFRGHGNHPFSPIEPLPFGVHDHESARKWAERKAMQA